MSQVNLQVPVDSSIKNKALVAAKALGFSSLQESVRLFLHQLAEQSLEVSFQPKPIKLSAKNDRRYEKMYQDYLEGKNIVKTKNLDDLFAKLNKPISKLILTSD